MRKINIYNKCLSVIAQRDDLLAENKKLREENAALREANRQKQALIVRLDKIIADSLRRGKYE